MIPCETYVIFLSRQQRWVLQEDNYAAWATLSLCAKTKTQNMTEEKQIEKYLLLFWFNTNAIIFTTLFHLILWIDTQAKGFFFSFKWSCVQVLNASSVLHQNERMSPWEDWKNVASLIHHCDLRRKGGKMYRHLQFLKKNGSWRVLWIMGSYLLYTICDW